MSAPMTDPTTILVRSKRESSFLKSLGYEEKDNYSS
jgi:hypothetical protein